MKRRLLLALPGILIVAFAVWRLWPQPPTQAVLTLYGDVDIRDVDMAFRQSGRLLQMLVDEGDRVRPGQLLARLDPQPYAQALAWAQANREQAAAQLLELEHGNRQQDSAQAEQQMQAEKALALNAAGEYKRQLSLKQDGTISAKQLDLAQANQDSTQAAWRAAQQHYHLLVAGARNEDITAARAHLRALQAAQEQAQTALADTSLYAPTAAIVFSRVREPGSMVTPAQAVYVLSVEAPVDVRAYVRESQLTWAQPGRQVWISHDGSSRRYSAHIGFVSPRAEFTPKTVETTDLRTDLVYRLRIHVDRPDAGLRQGMPVTVQLPIDPQAHD